MKYLAFITLCILTPITLLAQDSKYEIGLGGGLNMTSLHGESFARYFDWHYSAIGSVQVKYSFSDAYSLVSNVSYESKGCKGINLKLLDEEGKSMGSIYDFDFTYKYITVPVLFRYSSTSRHFFLNAGPYIGYMLQYTESYYGMEVDRTSDMKKMDIGFSFGGGLSYPISDKWGVSFELRNNLGLTNIWKDDQAYDPSVKPALKLTTITTNAANLLVMVNYKL